MKIVNTEYKTNEFGEIKKTERAKTWFEDLDLGSFTELLGFVKLLYPKCQISVRYENGVRTIVIVGSDFRRYIKII